jgi:iron(III) transport system permease protein
MAFESALRIENDRSVKHARDYYGYSVILLSFIIILLVAYPIGRMILRIVVVDGELRLLEMFAVFRAAWLPKVLMDTSIAVVSTTIGALAIGAVLAWLNERTDADLGFVGKILPVIPLFIPNVALAIGWVFLAAPRVGFINGFLAELPLVGRDGLQWSVNIYSWAGLIWVYVLNAVPTSYLIVSAALRNVDPQLEEASRVSGAGLWRTFIRVSLPAIRPSLLAAGLLLVISTFAMFSIPTIIATTAGIDLMPVRMVRLLRNEFPPQMAYAISLSLIMLAIVGFVWWLHRRTSRAGRFAAVGGKAAGSAKVPLGAWRRPLQALMVLYLVFASLLPLLALIVVALQPFWTATIDPSRFTLSNFTQVLFENRLTINAFKNSLFLAITGATIAMAVTAIIAIYTNMKQHLFAEIADTVLKWPATIPNLVIALGFLVTFSGAPFYLSGTVLLLLIAMIIIYVPTGSIAASSAVAQVGKDLAEASHICGAGENRTVLRIIVPLAMPGFVAGWTLVYVHMMGDLSAAALLAGLNNPVIGFVVLETWETGSFSLLAAFASTMCLVISVVVITTTTLFGFSGFRKT